MSEAQPALLALPPPRPMASAVAGLRASLRGAAAIPVNPVRPTAAVLDASFGSSIPTIDRDRSSDAAADGYLARPPQRPGAEDWIAVGLFADQSVPFLAQQLGQSGRLVVPTLDASAEIGAYAAAQLRAEQAAQRHETLLDIRA